MTREPAVSAPVDQRDVVAWLSTLRTRGGSVDRIDTHCSIVFLEGDRVYKLKRAVRYDYLDYSTIARRHDACLAEVALNKRTAPSIYLGVRAVTRESDGTFVFDGRGTPVDWVVEMVRFEANALLSHLAERQALDIALMPPLAKAIVRFHELAEWRFDYGGRDGMRAIVTGNAEGLEHPDTLALSAATLRQVTETSLAAIDSHTELLEQRRLSGFVRRGHGDLHLGNVCLVDGVPTLFDCIEFNEALASVDVLYDTAFLLMDLWYRGLARHASEVFNYYIRGSADLHGLGLLPLFLSTRATVRAKTSVTAAVVQRDPGGADRLRAEGERYLALAETLLSPPAARLIAVGGLSGTGKTTLARRLAPGIGPPPGALVLRSDVIRKELLGVAPLTRLGPEGYTDSVNHLVYRTLAERARTVLATGHAVVVDAVFAEARDRAAVADVGRACGVPFQGLWLDTSTPVMENRLRTRTDDESDATPEVLIQQQRRLSVPDGWTHLRADPDPDQVHRTAADALG